MHGAAGGLGTLAPQMLTTWGAKITAIARPPTMAGCLAAGVTEVVDGTNSRLPRSAARSMRHSISRRGMMISRSSAACGMVLWVMRAPVRSEHGVCRDIVSLAYCPIEHR